MTLKPDASFLCHGIFIERYAWSAPGFLGRWIHSKEVVYVPFFEACAE